jgi:hypothetical protein
MKYILLLATFRNEYVFLILTDCIKVNKRVGQKYSLGMGQR